LDNLYHLQNYQLLVKTLLLVVCCVGDKSSENFFFTLDNENRKAIWFFW